jgi:hypothetical protein
LSTDGLTFPRTLSEFYTYAVFVVFAVVIAQSFQESTAIFTPIDKLFTYDGIENALLLIFVYFFIVTSWVVYFKAITMDPHTETKVGATRFGVDLFIIFLYYYLLTQIPIQAHHGDIFVWVFPIIFVTFVIWDILRYREYMRKAKEPRETHANRKNRIVVTGLALLVSLVIAILYKYVIPLEKLTMHGVVVWNIVFIIVYFITIGMYRRRTWEHLTRSATWSSMCFTVSLLYSLKY